jgi:hypothetical protein
MFVVTYYSNGRRQGLKGTVWALSFERATQHETRDAAQAALTRAKPFMKARVYKAALIEELTSEQFAAICEAQS